MPVELMDAIGEANATSSFPDRPVAQGDAGLVAGARTGDARAFVLQARRHKGKIVFRLFGSPENRHSGRTVTRRFAVARDGAASSDTQSVLIQFQNGPRLLNPMCGSNP